MKNEPGDNNCPACDSKDFISLNIDVPDYEYRISYTPDLIFCKGCNLIRHETLPGYNKLGEFYPDDYLVYNKSFNAASNALYSKLKNKLYDIRAKKLTKLIGPKGNILDVGCANGAFLLSLKRLGDYGLYGLDIKNTGMNFAEHAIDFKEGHLEDLYYPEHFFNAVILDNVLEHVPDPVIFMHKVMFILKPGGYIFGTTPNYNSIDRFVFKKYWGGFHMPRHIYLFNANNLNMFMKKMGTSEVTFPLTANAADWAVSFQNFMRRKQEKQGTYKRASYFPLVAIALFPVALLSSLFNLNGVMDFVCVRR
ncbi:class I SAM-dependent methyltransferase [candidate division WS5 bacterium]|uniref:Class I SAM-dependent methyltransferase n=1 Tax=candidate division WS5 bacterium TaxID=2093353 RepID=A0A419DDC0_9BACT|nr:MAG: class I SAM-dependent methyltransferase [candidate division WS5 bacterium]